MATGQFHVFIPSKNCLLYTSPVSFSLWFSFPISHCLTSFIPVPVTSRNRFFRQTKKETSPTYASCAACGRSLYQVHRQFYLRLKTQTWQQLTCEFQCSILMAFLLVFPNDGYFNITTPHLSTAFFPFSFNWNFFSTFIPLKAR